MFPQQLNERLLGTKIMCREFSGPLKYSPGFCRGALMNSFLVLDSSTHCSHDMTLFQIRSAMLGWNCFSQWVGFVQVIPRCLPTSPWSCRTTSLTICWGIKTFFFVVQSDIYKNDSILVCFVVLLTLLKRGLVIPFPYSSVVDNRFAPCVFVRLV